MFMATKMASRLGDFFPSSAFLVSGDSSRAPSFFLYYLRCSSLINILIASLR